MNCRGCGLDKLSAVSCTGGVVNSSRRAGRSQLRALPATVIKSSRGHRDRCIEDTPLQCPGWPSWLSMVTMAPSSGQLQCLRCVDAVCDVCSFCHTGVVSWTVQGGHCPLQACGTGQCDQHHLNQPLSCPAQAPNFAPGISWLPFCQVLVLPGALGGALVMVFLRWA